MKKIGLAIVRSPQGRAVLALASLYLGWQAWLTLAAPGKVAPELTAGPPRVKVQVILPFTPERFHVIAMQRYGRVSGTDERSIEVRGVNRADLIRLARPFWVSRVEPMKGD